MNSRLANQLLDLVDLAQRGLGGAVTIEDLAEIRRLDDRAAARMALFRLRKLLGPAGLSIESVPVETAPGEVGQVFRPFRLEADWPAVLAWAQARLDERAEKDARPAQVEPKAPLRPGDLVDGKALAEAYRKDFAPPVEVNLVARLFGIGVERARRILGALYRVGRVGPPRVEERTDPTEARRLVLAGEPAWRVAQALRCSLRSAQGFARRVWGEVKQGARGVVTPRREPPDAAREEPPPGSKS